jgi:hypothetical protein
MKKILLVLTMLAASVLLAQPAIATLDDPGTSTADTGTSTESTPPTSEPEVPGDDQGAETPTDTPPETPADTPAETPADEPAPGGSLLAAKPDADAKKLVVCKFVSTPGGELDHIIIVDAPKGFNGVFPSLFTDAQDSLAIRYAHKGEQANEVALSACDITPPPDACPDVPGIQDEGTDCTTAVEKKVVVCKFVSKPGGELDHIDIVNESALGKGFQGFFPYVFGDAQDSVAIRFAKPNEQPHDVSISECVPPTEITAEAPIADPATCEADGSLVLPETDHVKYTVAPKFDGPGSYTVTASVTDEGFVLTGKTVFKVKVGGKLTLNCVEAAKEDELLPDTGGLPLWILLVAGPMVAGGLMILMRREPVSYATSSGRRPSYSLILPPVEKPAGIKRAQATQQIGFMQAVSKVVAAIGSFLRGGRR